MSRTQRIFRLSVCLLLSCAFAAGCATGSKAPEVLVVTRASEFLPQWRPAFKGIDIAYGRKLGPDPQAFYAARIDLQAKGIEFLVTPSNGEKPGETDGMRTSAFLQQHHLQLAVNASPFSPVAPGDGAPKDILGISASRGEVYSNPHGDFAALLISKDNKASVALPPIDTRNVYNAVSGFGPLLLKGQTTPSDSARHPRTAAGVSKDGRYLYLIVIDGRQPGYSVGATTGETAEYLRQLGAWDAVNLDGGGSSELVVAGPDGAPQIVNRPIHNNVPGNERVNGNNLGVYAK